MTGHNYTSVPPEVIRSNLADLDWAIIELLPDEGSTLGYHPAMKTVQFLARVLNEGVAPEGRVTTAQLGARLRGLWAGELTIPVSKSLTGKTDGWQRTELAVNLLAANKRGETQ